MRDSMKRFRIVLAVVVVAGAMGACADEPTGIDEPYTVQMAEGSDTTTACVIVAGRPICK